MKMQSILQVIRVHFSCNAAQFHFKFNAHGNRPVTFYSTSDIAACLCSFLRRHDANSRNDLNSIRIK